MADSYYQAQVYGPPAVPNPAQYTPAVSGPPHVGERKREGSGGLLVLLLVLYILAGD